MKRFLAASLFIFFFAISAHAAPVKARPATGIGLLVIRSSLSPGQDTPPLLVLYREPGVGRIAEFSSSAIPLLSRMLALPSGEYPVAVLGKKGTWLRIAYDEAGREGWLEPLRGWDYVTWSEFLPGHSARLLPGLKKPFYVIMRQPADTAVEISGISPETAFRILEVKESWARIESAAVSGWLRWQDSDGRFLISRTVRNEQQKD